MKTKAIFISILILGNLIVAFINYLILLSKTAQSEILQFNIDLFPLTLMSNILISYAFFNYKKFSGFDVVASTSIGAFIVSSFILDSYNKNSFNIIPAIAVLVAIAGIILINSPIKKSDIQKNL